MQFHCPNLVATASQHVPSGYEGENRLEAGREYVRIYGRLLAFVLIARMGFPMPRPVVRPLSRGPMQSMSFIIGRKLEMSQLFREDGTVVPVTIVKAEPNTVTQIRGAEKDGYVAVQLGSDVRRHLTLPESGHLKDLPSFGVLREFRVEETTLKRGDTVNVELFKPGMKIDVVGISKGHGFTGVMRRHHFHGGPATHGQKDQMRMPGSIASQRQGPVSKGQRMAGHMGDARTTVKNLEIVAVDPVQNTLAIKGAVPGARGGILLITARDGKRVWQR